MLMGSLKINHTRHIYNLVDLVGDLAGVFDLFIAILAFLMIPLAKHSFILDNLHDNYKVEKQQKSIVDNKRR
jgi:hypothetical protein